ncbi:hypothetical protein [Lactiplantibacillus plantarum]|uniref:hypothetical protein n=1 Tax=Lactiplantibacillus plantarum TaxID=1590 RepID=UPI00402B836F
MGKRKRLWLWFKRISCSKIAVLLAILGVWMIGSQVQQAHAQYSPSVAYQYYLLGEESDSVQQDSKDQKAAMNVGSLGSGGVAGEFSYDDIVNSASQSQKAGAKQFASIMATYSTFNYFSNRVEGFAVILPFVGRWLSAIILLPLAVLMDLLSSVVPALVGVIAKLNVVRFLADALTNLNFSSSLADALGINMKVFQGIANALLSFLVIMILLTLGRMFKLGGRVDQEGFSKLKGRLFSLVAIPVMLGAGATLIGDVLDITMNSADSNTSAFKRYLVDDRSWAYNYNFAPNGNNAKDGNISPDNTSSYVDLDFNPYTKKGGDRIDRINSSSSLASDSNSKFNFANSALVLSFVSSEAFSAVDYINYKGTDASQAFYGQNNVGAGDTYGSYYKYAIGNQKELADVSNSYNPSGSMRSPQDKHLKTGMNGGYKSAIDDYVEDKKLKVSPQIAWRDRFIYGAKSSGENIDKYYKEAPSYEQMTNEVGTKSGNAFSDQSMFLILSTMFGETGGKYYIDAPARGVMQVKATFDSNRSNYFVVSMVGNPFFTIFGLIAKPIVQLVVLCAVVFAVLEMGFIDMNLRPFVAWLKGSTLGDIEYAYALLVYSIGIAGTILALTVIPELFTRAVEYIPDIVNLGLDSAGVKMHTPQASLSFYGVKLIFQASIALILGFIFLKSKTFRNRFIELFTFAWAWAKTTGERLEQQASRGSSRIKREQQSMHRGLSSRMAGFTSTFSSDGDNEQQKPSQRMRNWMKETGQGIKDDLGIKPILKPKDVTPTSSEESFENYGTEPVMDAKDIARNGMYERSLSNLQGVQDNVPQHVQTALIEAENVIMALRNNPSQEGYNDALNRISVVQDDMAKDGITDDRFNQVNQARDEVQRIGHSYNYDEDPESPVSPKENNLGDGDLSQRENDSQRIIPATTTIYNDNQQDQHSEDHHTEDQHSDEDYRTYQNTDDNRSFNTVNSPNNTTVNNKRYEVKEVQQLANTLGDASGNKDIANALQRMNNAKDNTQVQRGLSKLQESISHLDLKDREKIDNSELAKSLDRVADLNRNKE